MFYLRGLQLMGQDIQLFVSMITRAVVQGYTLRQREVWPRPPSALSARGSPPAGPARRAPLSLVWPPARRVGQYPQANRQGPGDNCTGCDHLAHPALAHWPRTRLLLHPAVRASTHAFRPPSLSPPARPPPMPAPTVQFTEERQNIMSMYSSLTAPTMSDTPPPATTDEYPATAAEAGVLQPADEQPEDHMNRAAGDGKANGVAAEGSAAETHDDLSRSASAKGKSVQ
eukprot:scaffold28754_cov30-Tisochrysis_lutea.AAC.2